MCNSECISFVQRTIGPDDVKGRSVIEVGSHDVNGSVRPHIEGLAPASYVGIDIKPGPGVDVVCDAELLIDRFGTEQFDLVVSTELLEHLKDWRAVISGIKLLSRPGGLIVLTTRSRGFPIHGFPDDYWRYQPSDMRVIFGDCHIEHLEVDRSEPGVFVAARRPASVTFEPFDLSGYALHSSRTDRRTLWPADSCETERARLSAELTALRQTKTFRYTAGLRNLYSKVRER